MATTIKKNPGVEDYDDIYKSILSGYPGYQGSGGGGGGADAYDAALRRFEGAYDQASGYDPTQARGIASDLSQALSQIKAGEDTAANKAGIYYSGERLGRLGEIGSEAVGAAEDRLSGLGTPETGPRPMPVAGGADLGSAVRGVREQQTRDIASLREQARTGAESKAAEMRAEQEYRMMEQKDEQFRGAMDQLRGRYAEAVRSGRKDESAGLLNLAAKAGGMGLRSYLEKGSWEGSDGTRPPSAESAGTAAWGTAQVGDYVPFSEGPFAGLTASEYGQAAGQAYPSINTGAGTASPTMYDVDTGKASMYSLPGSEGGADAGGGTNYGYAAGIGGGLLNAYLSGQRDDKVGVALGLAGAGTSGAAMAGSEIAGQAAGGVRAVGAAYTIYKIMTNDKMTSDQKNAAIANAGLSAAVAHANPVMGIVNMLVQYKMSQDRKKRARRMSEEAEGFYGELGGMGAEAGAGRLNDLRDALRYAQDTGLARGAERSVRSRDGLPAGVRS